MLKYKTGAILPFHVRRAIWGYKPHLREAIAKSVRARYDELKAQGKEITPDDISECVGAVVGELVFGSHDRNPTMEQLCMEAYQRGEYKLLKDVIDELRARIADSPSA